MSDKEYSTKEEQKTTTVHISEGCLNCEFNEYRDGRNYCSEYEKYVKDCDPPCKAYVEHGSY